MQYIYLRLTPAHVPSFLESFTSRKHPTMCTGHTYPTTYQ